VKVTLDDGAPSAGVVAFGVASAAGLAPAPFTMKIEAPLKPCMVTVNCPPTATEPGSTVTMQPVV
jgi:hypothetical protein